MRLASEPAEEQAEAPGPKPRRSRGRRGVLAAGLVIVVAAGVSVAVARPFGTKAKPQLDNGAPTAVASVTQGKLSARTQVSGKLDYAGTYDAVNQASGTVTYLPKVGTVIHQGEVLYKLDNKPIILLQGSVVPAYRALSSGTSGEDVRQLNADLVALGYASKDDLDPHSKYFGSATVDAVDALQKKLGVDETGQLDLGTVVFLATDTARITNVSGTLGASAHPGGTIMQATSVNRQVTVALDTALQSQVKVGDQATIDLPGNHSAPGTVSSVGTVATAGQSGGSSTITVQITLKDPSAAGGLDQAPVQVSIITGSVDNALAVPVNALLALAGGGYAIEVVDPGGARRLVPVSVGMFDDGAGTVQITGAGVAAGQRVVVPAS